MSGTSSARPDELIAYSAQMYTEGEVVIENNDVQEALDTLSTSSGTYVGCFIDLGTNIDVAVRKAQELDLWVGAVGQAFLAADGGSSLTVTVSDDDVIANLPPGMADPPSESRRRAEEGEELFRELQQATDDHDHDRIEELLADLEERADDVAFMAGFAIAAEESLGSVDDLEDMLRDGMQPEDHDGFWGGVGDFFLGAWDAVWGTLTFLYDLSTIKMFTDPQGYAEAWSNLGGGLWHGVTNPIEFLKAIVDVDGLQHNPARWVGSFVPDLAVTVFSGGAGATTRGARGARSLDALADAADALRDLDRLDDAAGASRHLDELGELDDLTDAARRLGLDLDDDLARQAEAMREGFIDRGLPPDVADRIVDRIVSGNQFNRDNWANYPFNELRLSNGKVLDSYDPVTGEIVSRKYTQLSDIQLSTARSYINEIDNKYAPGTDIARTPSVVAQEERFGRPLDRQLDGDVILEVPPQLDDVPQAVLDYARSRGVIIRTSEGVVLTP
jgi:hypothetical protein